MSQKERFDAFMHLANFHFACWRMRQGLEWKISVGVWALLAALTAGTVYIPDTPPTFMIVIILLAIVLGHAVFWVGPIRVRNDHDKDMALHYTESAERILSPDLPIAVHRRPSRVAGFFHNEYPWAERWRTMGANFQIWYNWGATFQVTATLALAAYVFWIVISKKHH
ncbi:MAG TPA: hypothetical protein VFL28_08525 [bacterium]|nr:hypothetical protein [bacterium]